MDIIESYKFENAMEWQKWIRQIPFIPVKADWQIAPLPPFGGAVARFRVLLPDGREKSVYLDCYDRLGCVGEPYWEVYPSNGDVGRCLMAEVDQLVALIESPNDEEETTRDEKWSDWIDWSGGECPVDKGADVSVRYRNGEENIGLKAGICLEPGGTIKGCFAVDWDHIGSDFDIIAYRYKIKEPESAISDPDEEECLQLAYERMGYESVKVSVDELRGQSKSGGMKYDSDKPAMDLIPPYMEEEVGMVLAFGAQKYAPGNWRKVTPLRSRYLAAAQRHINALKKGEQMDPESGLHHAAHAVCCLMFLGEVELEPEND